MKCPASRALFSYWASQCHGRSAPDRHDLDPAEMRGALPHTFMLEVDTDVGGRTYPIRISGTRLDALFGRALKGVSFADLWSPHDAGEMQAILSGVLDDARPAVVGFHAAPDGYPTVALELLLLPLRHHGRTHARLLCSLVPDQTPTWLGLAPIASLTLQTWRSIDRQAEGLADMNRAGGAQHRHLMVFEGGRSAKLKTAGEAQSHVKASVPKWHLRTLSTRRS